MFWVVMPEYQYLVLDGEHAGQVIIGPYCRILRVRSARQPMAVFVNPELPAPVLVPLMVYYPDVEYITNYGAHYYIAHNGDVSDIDIAAEIARVNLQPCNQQQG